MKELSRKTFLTIAVILSVFLISGICLVNIQNYKREYENVRRNLAFINERIPAPKPDVTQSDDLPGDKPLRDNLMKEGIPEDKDEFSDIENMKIMDYEVYTVKVEDGEIKDVINHGNEDGDFDVETIAKSIISLEDADRICINNLYFSKYSYNYRYNDSVVIINDSAINVRLRKFLLESILLFVVLEILNIVFSLLITKWITKPAKSAFERQKEFIADASHELKTPLAVIMASSDELVGQENQKYIENIRYESERMNKLIAGLLDLSKLENDKNKESFKEHNLSKIVEKQALTYEAIAFEKEALIETDIKKDVMFKCNKDEMEKLVSTILDNAIKHSYTGKPITVDLYKEKNTIRFKVTNFGDPIREGDEERIFERFYRGDKARARGDNRYGLGLAIAKRIVINHGGSIRAYSKDGKTTFSVKL